MSLCFEHLAKRPRESIPESQKQRIKKQKDGQQTSVEGRKWRLFRFFSRMSPGEPLKHLLFRTCSSRDSHYERSCRVYPAPVFLIPLLLVLICKHLRPVAGNNARCLTWFDCQSQELINHPAYRDSGLRAQSLSSSPA